MNIKGTFGGTDGDRGGTSQYTGAFYNTNKYFGSTTSTSGDDNPITGFDASKKWTGSTSAGTAHSHSFSSSATIGSGNYTRPNSVSCLYIISY